MGKLQINVLGTSFKVQAQEDQEYLEKLLSFYKDIAEAVKKSGNISDPLQISILSGITLVDELYKEKQKNAALTQQLMDLDTDEEEKDEAALNMLEKLTKALDDNE